MLLVTLQKRKIADPSPPKHLLFLVELCDYRPTPDAPPTRVAVKRLRPGCSLGVADLALEARVLASLRHPNIVRFLGIGAAPAAASAGASPARAGVVGVVGPSASSSPCHGPDPLRDDCCYLVQAYVSGGTLKRAVGGVASRPPGAPPPYSLAEAAAWGADVAAGLAFLHGANPVIVHRDLKLENVLLTRGDGGGGGSGAPSPSHAAPHVPPGAAPAPPTRRVALLADFGLAASFVSPDLDTRRSALAAAPTSAWWRGGGRAASTTSSSGAAAGAPPALPDLGRPRASAVAAQLARLAAGEAMDDARVSAAAGALEAALSAWGEGAAGRRQARAEAGRPEPAHPRPKSNRAVFALTAKTGSYLYMAPEITLGTPYNQAADIHSLGVLLWEVLAGRTVAAVVLAATPAGADLGAVAELYAHRVARGFRPPIPPAWPELARSLVSACWAHAPEARPRAAAVAAALAGLAAAPPRLMHAWQPAWAGGLPSGGEAPGGGGGGGGGEGGGRAGGVGGGCCACM